MKGERKKLAARFACCIVMALAVLLIAACGYSIRTRSSLPFAEVRIAPVVNKTMEPKLQDKLHKALTEEFMKQGVRVYSAADYTLSVTIDKLSLVSLAEKEGIAVDYRVTADVDFRFLDRSGKVLQRSKVSSPFIVTVTEAANLGSLMAFKEVAEEEAMRDIAMEIVGALIYR